MNMRHLFDRALAGFGRAVPSIPAVVVAALPALACPACWPAYAASVAVLGIPALMSSPYLPYLLGGLLLVALLPLAVRAARGGGAVPLWIALAASAVVLVGKFGLDSDATTYAGTAALIIAPYWYTIARKARRKPAVGCGCAADASTTTRPGRGAAVCAAN